MGDPQSAASDVRLSASAAVVLGLLANGGAQTTYDMAQYIEVSIGYFWPFPNSQLYAETKRLEVEGLIAGEQEDFGRRRRLYSVTDEGREALDAWLVRPVDRLTEIRDVGLLKLFLSDQASAASVVDLATAQIELHQARLDEYRGIAAGLVSDVSDELPRATRTLELGISFEQVAIEFWQGVADKP